MWSCASVSTHICRNLTGSVSLAFISLAGLRAAVPDARCQGFCDACFTGDYPVEIPSSVAKKSFMTKKDFEDIYAEGDQ